MKILTTLIKEEYKKIDEKDKSIGKVYIVNGKERVIKKQVREEINIKNQICEELIIKKAYAHCLGSDESGDYLLAYKLLEKLALQHKFTNAKEYKDLMTASISNRRRIFFSNDHADIQSHLYELIIDYNELFIYRNEYSYYTGINLSYIIKIYDILGFNLSNFSTISSLNKIYDLSKTSLLSDKDELNSKYWANISEIEFKILNSNDVSYEIRKLLLYFKENKITKNIMIIVVRQFEFYTLLIAKFLFSYKKDKLFLHYSKTIEHLKNIDFDSSKIDEGIFS